MEPNRAYQNGWWLVLGGIATVVIYSIIMSITGQVSGYISMLIGEAALIIPAGVGIYLISKNGNSFKDNFKIRGFEIWMLPFLIILPLSIQYFSTYVYLPVNIVMQVLLGFGSNTDGFLTPQNVNDFIMSFLILCVAAPILEELIYRAVLIKLFEPYGIVVSLVASSLAFTICHLDGRTLVPIFFIGMVFGMAYIITKSIFTSIIMHAVVNFTSLLLMTFMGDNTPQIFVIIVLVVAASAPLLLYSFLKTCNKKNYFKNISIKPHYRPHTSVAMVICITFYIALNMLTVVNRIATGEFINQLQTLIP